jgi:hypothetical protein
MKLDDYNPGFDWYLAFGRRIVDDNACKFQFTEFVRCHRGCKAAAKRAMKKHGHDAIAYYRPTGCFVTAQECAKWH